jgi:hypothetical protein
MTDEQQRPNAEGPEATDEENEASTSRQQEEEAMRGPGHENPDLPREEQIYDE